MAQPNTLLQEAEYFKDDSVLVTGTRVIIGGVFYPTTSIAAASVTEIAHKAAPGTPVLVAGIICALAGGALLLAHSPFPAYGAALFLGLVLILVGAARIRASRPHYAVTLRTGSGEAQALVSYDRRYVGKIVAALNKAIGARRV